MTRLQVVKWVVINTIGIMIEKVVEGYHEISDHFKERKR